MTTELAARCLPLIDLTRLGDDDSPADIMALCDGATSPFGAVAAVCVHPEFVVLARQRLSGTGVRVATVVNFPDGGSDVARAVRETRRVIGAGTDEIDVVFPWRDFQSGRHDDAMAVIRTAREAAPNAVLKVILETGQWPDAGLLRHASDLLLAAGADFLKTSTGKSAIHATPDAARILMTAVRDAHRPAGVKVSGGIRTVQDAAVYLHLAEELLGTSSVVASRFRIGASALLDDVIQTLGRSMP